MDTRLAEVPVVTALAAALEETVQGVYVGGSVASGDYHPGVSDIDAFALLDRSPDAAARRGLVATHRHLLTAPSGPDLHCAYVDRRHVGDPAYRHWTWAFDE